MTIASSTRGRKSPIWCSDARIGSSSMSMLSIASSLSPRRAVRRAGARVSVPMRQNIGQAGERNAHPVRPVVDLVAQLVDRLFEQEQLEQRRAPSPRGERKPGARATSS